MNFSGTWFHHALSWRSFVLSAGIAFAPIQGTYAAPPAGLDDFVKQAMVEYKVPGASVAVVEGDHIFARGYGKRSINKPDPVDADTLFMIASVTKAFTSALVGIMVDEGKVGWDDHVVDHLPQFMLADPYATRMCTARDLLAHRSGLPAFTGDNLEALGFNRAEVMRRIRYLESPYSFRERAGYSNPGIFVAGMLAAKVGGASYEELIARRLFEPLGMFRSGVSFRDHDIKANVADAHMINPDGTTKVVKWDNSDILGPAGEITSTANDLAHFAQMQLNDGRFNGKQIVSVESIHQMHKPAMVEEPSFAEMAPIDADSGFAYGLGWGVYHYKGHKILEKSGARMGMRSTVVLIPDKKLGFVVLCNQNLTVLPEAVRAYLMENMVERSGEDLQAKIRAANESIQKMFCLKQDTEVKPASVLSLPLEKYTGEYENKLYGRFSIYIDDGKLRWRAGPAKISGPLDPVAYNTFLFKWPGDRISLPEEVTFTISPQGVPSLLTTESCGQLVRVASKAASSK